MTPFYTTHSEVVHLDLRAMRQQNPTALNALRYVLKGAGTSGLFLGQEFKALWTEPEYVYASDGSRLHLARFKPDLFGLKPGLCYLILFQSPSAITLAVGIPGEHYVAGHPDRARAIIEAGVASCRTPLPPAHHDAWRLTKTVALLDTAQGKGNANFQLNLEFLAAALIPELETYGFGDNISGLVSLNGESYFAIVMPVAPPTPDLVAQWNR